MKLRTVEILSKLHNCTKNELVKTGIYTITSKATNKLYVGSACRTEATSLTHLGFGARWWQHTAKLIKNKHANIKLQRHVNKYGIEDLKFEILDECLPKFANSTERLWINLLDSVNTGFNLRYPESLVTGKSHHNFIDLNEKLVLDLYLNEKLTVAEIARLQKVSETPISRVLLKHKIKIRNNFLKLDYKSLHKEYLNSYLSTEELGAIHGVSQSTILRGFKRNKFLLRQERVELEISIIYDRYLNGESVIECLAGEYKTSGANIYNLFRKYNLNTI